MKISQKLPRFEDKKALLIVTGAQTADFYFARDGEITEVGKFKIDNPKYSDREGYFKRTGHGEVMGSGSVYEPKDEAVRNEFLLNLEKESRIAFFETGAEEVYLFAPKHVLKENLESLHKKPRGVVKMTMKGQFTKDSPIKLLERLKKASRKEERLPPNIPGKRQARKILEKFKKASKYIGRKFKK